jgi:serpin B
MKNSTRKLRLILLVSSFFALILSACSGNFPVIGGNKLGAGVTLAKSDLTRQTNPQVSDESLEELVAGNNEFAFDLYHAVQDKEGNLFFSPYNLGIGLAMTYAGARGETERQMADTLHYTLPQDRLHPAFNALALKLGTYASNDSIDSKFQLNIANSLWGQQDFPLNPAYLDLLARDYAAAMRLVDFLQASNRERARRAINNWVSHETQGKIKNLIGPNILNASTRLVLANAIYFYGDWDKPFLDGTEAAPFTLLDGSQINVQMMSRRAHTAFAQGDGYQAIELSYKGGPISMLIFVPESGRFIDFERSINANTMHKVTQAMQSQDVELYLPKFQFEAQFTLAEALSEMGMPAAFDSTRADFTGIYDQAEVEENLFISHVLHKTFINVNEIGTEAAAASGVVMEITSVPIVVRVDRPFIFLIRDRESGTILFAGRVTNPS